MTMKKITKAITAGALAVGVALGLAACSTEAQTSSYNLSRDADSFKIERRVVFFNGITDTNLLSIEGRCSIEPDVDEAQLEVTCKVGEDQYKKHFLGLSDNVSYFIEQLEPADVDAYHYKVIFRPETIIPDIDLQTSNG